MFLPWMIALHGFTYGGCEHCESASEIIFHILSNEAGKVSVPLDDLVFLRENGGNTYNDFVKERHTNSGTCYDN